MTEIVRYELSGDIAAVTMDDGKANALSPDLLDQLSAALDRAESEARAVVLAGREGRFCAGFDLKIMMQGPQAATGLLARGSELLLRLYELPRPVVIACTGHAIAGGALLAATGDTVIGARGAFKIGLNEVQMGMPVPILAHELARARLLPTELFAAVVQAKIYDPDSAAAAGWLDRVVDPGELAGACAAEATRLAALPDRAYAHSKRSLRRETIKHIRETMQANVAEMMGG
jgi:enoyl-CoA hydratase